MKRRFIVAFSMLFMLSFTMIAQNDVIVDSSESSYFDNELTDRISATAGFEDGNVVASLEYDVFSVSTAVVALGAVKSDQTYLSYNVQYPWTSWLYTEIGGRTSFYEDPDTQWQASLGVPLHLGSNQVDLQATYNISEEYFGGYLSFRF